MAKIETRHLYQGYDLEIAKIELLLGQNLINFVLKGTLESLQGQNHSIGIQTV